VARFALTIYPYSLNGLVQLQDKIVARFALTIYPYSLDLDAIDPLEASSMHGHMIDFKKRGGYLRNRWRRIQGKAAPDYGLRPSTVGLTRIAVEIVISGVFLICRTRPARWIVERIPEKFIGPLLNRLRLIWKSASKPTKRKNLGNLAMELHTPSSKAK